MKPKIVIGVLVIVAALVYLVIGGFKDTAVYYMTVKELYAETEGGPFRTIRHGGGRFRPAR